MITHMHLTDPSQQPTIIYIHTTQTQTQTVYIGVQGQTQQNAFNIIVWDQLFRVSDVRVDILDGGSGQRLIYDVGQNLLERAPTTR